MPTALPMLAPTARRPFGLWRVLAFAALAIVSGACLLISRACLAGMKRLDRP